MNDSIPLKNKSRLRAILFLLLFALSYVPGFSQDLQQQVQDIEKEIAVLRGAPFKHPIQVKRQSLADFGKYIDAQIAKQYPDAYLKNYGKIVRKLGLYRGPEIKNYKEMAKMVIQSQAAAYYDPATKTFYVVMQNLPEMMQKTVFAHELYHGFQDQYFDLNHYYLSQTQGKLNEDELLARQAVVEGEATYVMTLWSLKHMFGKLPERSMLDMTIRMQSNMNVKQLLQMVKGGMLPQAQTGDMQKAVKAMDDIPAFILETMIGAYLKGMAFVSEIQKQGWEKVAALYKTPPASSEQILHPEKWLSHENPARIRWQDFGQFTAFKNWSLLDANTLGEFQWRIIFSEHGMQDTAVQAAAGWQGDRYAVLQNKQSPERLLLLLLTVWDSPKEADEFYTAYQRVLDVKYPQKSEPIEIVRDGKRVYIVEGGDARDSASFLSFIKSATVGR